MSLQIPIEKRAEYINTKMKELGIRFVNKTLSEKLNETKGNVSDYLNGAKPMSENFWKKFLEQYCAGDEAQDMPNYTVDMQDYINALKKQVEIAEINNEFLRRMMESEVSRVRISLELLQDDQLSSIALIKGAMDTQAEIAGKVLDQPVDSVKLKTGKAIAAHATTLKQRGKATSNQSR